MHDIKWWLSVSTPGITGDAGADDGVEHSDGDVALMEDAVHPLIRENVSWVADGWTCSRTHPQWTLIILNETLGYFAAQKLVKNMIFSKPLPNVFFHGTIIVIWLSACFHGQNSDDWHWIAQQNAKNIKVRFNCFSCFSTSVYSQCINLT